jgi:hypothetical protein
VAVPLSLVGTFGVMYALGYSLNNLTLMALTISTGFVVDDAIVVTENIARYIEEGDAPFEAALKGARQIGFTGGKPFMNPDIIGMLEDALTSGFEVLVLTNAMAPLRHKRAELLRLQDRYGASLRLRVSMDHYAAPVHEAERGRRSFAPTLDGLIWLARHGFAVDVASRMLSGEPEAALRAGFARLFAQHAIAIDAADPVRLMLFPEMDAGRDVPEITTACWGILHKTPDSVMCSSARMVVKRAGAERPAVLACTLLAYDPQFELGATLAEASRPVALNHPHCASFCVLGGAACSR